MDATEKVGVGGGGWGFRGGAGGVGLAVVQTPGGGTLLPLRGPNFDLAGELESRLELSFFLGIFPTKGIAFFIDDCGSGVFPLRPNLIKSK